ncbi:hypothetical protein O0L34_g7327 [Tuta absoluta]|nr:hypothetical protein O0L34_g7327 [Tuta absoluta]
MRVFVVLAVIVGAAFGAPTEELSEIQKRSPYGAPCGAAPVALYLSSGPGLYREDEHLGEEKASHSLQARSYGYGGPASAASAAAALAAAAAGAAAAAPAAPAVGIFPGAKVGGCAVPLLLSCAPSVHAGHIAHSAYPAAPAYPAIAAPAYRTEGDLAKIDHSAKLREMVPQKEWTGAEHTAKNTLMRESGPVKSWSEVAREQGVAKGWSEVAREQGPAKSWAESARAMELAPVQPHHHHHLHHIDGDLDTELPARNN